MFATEGTVNDKLGVVGVIQPQSITAGATGVLTAAIDMKDFERVVFVVQSGTLGTSGTLDVTGEASDAAAGTYAPLAGKSATQLVKATGDNKVVVVEVTQDDVAKVGKRFVKFRIAAGTAAATSGGVVIGVPASYGKGRDFNIAAVAQTL
jgi:hypothetical protein